MKTIGLLGGMSWQSTAIYYRLINETTKRRRGGLHSAPIAMVSVDFAEVEALQQAGDWEGSARLLGDRARRVEAAGAEFVLICSNTMHKVADRVEAALGVPLLHLADATARQLRSSGVTTVGLLGTRFTMEESFYRDRLSSHGLEVIVPEEADRAEVHRVIYEELCLGEIRDESRASYLRIINDLGSRGADAVIAGCTEIGLLVQQEHTQLPIFDTTEIHANAAVALALTN